MQLFRPWSALQWCSSVTEPHWPFAYAKVGNETVEAKGRTALDLRNHGHVCNTRGAESKCHRCEAFACGAGLGSTCQYEVQGVASSRLAVNIPSVNDAPWAVRGTHRNDFGGSGTTHACVMVSGGACQDPSPGLAFDFAACRVQCWGFGGQGARAKSFPAMSPDTMPARDETVGWAWRESVRAARPQGKVWLLMGSPAGVGGHRDGPAAQALLRSPSAVAVDRDGNVFVADTGNHVVRMLERATGRVSTIAGVPGQSGFRDGAAAQALFASPKGLALYYDWGVKLDQRTGSPVSNGVGELVLVVSDTNNHRLRRIVLPRAGFGAAALGALRVETLAGRFGLEPQAGLADGDRTEARFNLPLGVAAGDDGVVFVADSHNHVIRQVLPCGDVFTLAGTVASQADWLLEFPGAQLNASCAAPCLRGVPGLADGPLRSARFSFPQGVAIGLQSTILVVDNSNRVRRVTRANTTSVVQGVTFRDSVSTVAGSPGRSGEADGPGDEATFSGPRGVAMDTLTGRIFVADTASCRVRRISPATQVARMVTCTAALLDVVRPSGCQSYEPPLDAVFLQVSDVAGDTHYNFVQRNQTSALNGWDLTSRGFWGRSVKRCLGAPPPAAGVQSTAATLGPQDDTGAAPFVADEDTDQGTAIHIRCPAGCAGVTAAAVWGSSSGGGGGGGGGWGFSDASSLCRAAVLAGVVDDALGGLARIVVLPGTTAVVPGAAAHGVTSAAATGPLRGFRVEPYLQRQVQVGTSAGAPASSEENACGAPAPQEGTGGYSLPQAARFRLPSGVALPANRSLAAGGLGLLYVADEGNHAVRAMTATCAKVCENGGECTADETCACAAGWTGVDCTVPVCTTARPGARTVCVAPDTWDCVPGYAGLPACTTPLCVQACRNGGSCVAPDTCGCAAGWIDANCTTPVCPQTCGNGGNCTGPAQCTCPTDWTGADCRVPVCTQTCRNGGACIAPDTCYCTPQWSGHDCSLPVCMQGFVAPDPSAYMFAAAVQATRAAEAARRPLAALGAALPQELAGTHWRQFQPCDAPFAPRTWCNATNEFDCSQPTRTTPSAPVLRGQAWRRTTGFGDPPLSGGAAITAHPECVRLEVRIGARTYFPYESASRDGALTPLWRYPPATPYGWDAPFAPGPDTLANWTDGQRGWRAPGNASSDRTVAWARWALVQQGAYVCANGGNCTAPNTCSCGPGWIGFDCRTPVCAQGYYEPPSAAHPGKVELDGGVLVDQPFPNQGVYECSVRSVTRWENRSFLWEHPNYYSRYMDHHADEWSPRRYQIAPETPHYWDNMGWPATYSHSAPDGNHTSKGWTRAGTWSRIAGRRWQKGKCKIEFQRTCPANSTKEQDLWNETHSAINDTLATYVPQVTYTDEKVSGNGRWHPTGGECVDTVLRGCFNNGTCVAPGTCECRPGWTGADCSVPVCSQTCSRNLGDELGLDNNQLPVFDKGVGWCTLPDTCTCERGWSGPDCSTPLCAQECVNGGKCTAPDTCSCSRWESRWRDNQRDGGHPVFQDDHGSPMLTGWTGYDCATPICVQGKSFVLNDRVGTRRLGGYGLILYGDEPYNNLFRPDLHFPPYLPYTLTNDIPPVKVWLPQMRSGNEAIWLSADVALIQERFRLCRMKGQRFCVLFPDAQPLPPTWSPGDGEVVRNDGRSFQSGCMPWSARWSDLFEGVHEGFLCNVLRWEQGDYTAGRYIRRSNDATSYRRNVSLSAQWAAGPGWYKDLGAPTGEGVYECLNQGACVAPDTCTCADGYTGANCGTPLCRHRQPAGQVVSCLNGGACAAKDNCTCAQTDSILHKTFPEVRKGKTGFNGTDCSVPMCMQGTFDAACEGVTPGGEGCFRCKNGGNCTAPDFCTCPPEWTGYDCGTPVCKLRADDRIVEELQTIEVVKVHAFELDPCQHDKRFLWNGFWASQGNCTAPGYCTCACRERAMWLPDKERWSQEPWHSPLGSTPPIGSVEGTMQCVDGYEGTQDNSTGLFRSCHLRIYVPKWYERYAITLIVLSVLVVLGCVAAYIEMRRKARRVYLLARAERRLANDDQEVVPLNNQQRARSAKTIVLRKGAGIKASKKKRRTERKVA